MISELKVNKLLEISNDISLKLNYTEKKIPRKVNIHTLMLRVREKEKKQKKESIAFLCLVSAVVVVTGLVASL
ncbi:hypothetical protein N9862_00570 [bacterium]|nr:hypothetical protein [bacterium]